MSVAPYPPSRQHYGGSSVNSVLAPATESRRLCRVGVALVMTSNLSDNHMEDYQPHVSTDVAVPAVSTLDCDMKQGMAICASGETTHAGLSIPSEQERPGGGYLPRLYVLSCPSLFGNLFCCCYCIFSEETQGCPALGGGGGGGDWLHVRRGPRLGTCPTLSIRTTS
ncbi:unnamed protein product [Arctogadus glacialis]